MKYIVLVSHGNLAPGFENALRMLAGSKREDILSVGLKEDTGADGFSKELEEKLEVVKPEDEVLLYGDIIGGSPLTTAANVISQKGLLGQTHMVGGVNLPFILASALMKDNLETGTLIDTLISEARGALQTFEVSLDDEASDDEI